MLDEAAELLDFKRIKDFSAGTFRISDSYLKSIRRALPESAAVQYPFELENGYYHYPDSLENEMEGFMTESIRQKCNNAEIFLWKE